MLRLPNIFVEMFQNWRETVCSTKREVGEYPNSEKKVTQMIGSGNHPPVLVCIPAWLLWSLVIVHSTYDGRNARRHH